MKFTEEEGQHFYDLWLPLLQWANHQYKVTDVLPENLLDRTKGHDPEGIQELAGYVYDHPDVIEAYVKANPDGMNEEDLQTISDWKYNVQGMFVVERILKKGAIFIKDEDSVFRVSPILSPWDEVLPPYLPLPLMVQTTLLPYKGTIIYGSLIGVRPIIMGPGMKRHYKEDYLAAKKHNAIISTAEELIERMM